MPPELIKTEDICLTANEAWQSAARQMRTEEMVTFVNTRDSEEGYPFLKSELCQLHLFKHRVNPNVHPQSPCIVTQAFGNFMFSKLVRTLREKDLIVRQKSVTWCVELMSVGENRARCVLAGIVPILADMLQEKDMYIRQQLALCFKLLAEAGQDMCDLMCFLNVVKGLILMAGNDNTVLRGNALQALEALCAVSQTVRKEVMKGGKTLRYILKRIKEEYDVKCTIWALEVLAKCISCGNYDETALVELLQVDAVKVALALIQTPFRELQEAACRFLCLLCMHKDGKRYAVEEKAVQLLVPMLNDIEPRVQAFACAALCCITIEIQGKKDFVLCDGIPIILRILNLTDEQLCLYDIALLINVAEYPMARSELFKQGLILLRSIVKESTSPLMKKRAKLGLQQLHFNHLPHIFPYDKQDKLYLKETQFIAHKASLPPDAVLRAPTPVSPSFSPRTSPPRAVRHTI
ncbi:unnamed protein product [Calypogeia fissa]